MSEKIRILSIGHSYTVALNRSILREIARDENFEVTVVSPQLFKGSLRTIKAEAEPSGSALKFYTLPAYFTQKMHFFFYHPVKLKKILNQGYDLAHFWEEPYILAGYQLARQARKSKVPYLFRTAQSLIKKYLFPFSYFEKKTLASTQSWVAGGRLVHQAMIKKGFPQNGRIITLAVDTNAFKPFNSEQKKMGLNQLNVQGPLLGYLGRLSEEKGLDLLMRSLIQLKHKKWNFLIMGSGPYEEKIRDWIEKEGFKDRVILKLLKHDEVPKFLPLCDVLLAPSQTRPFWKEQFGRMIVEAFACGVPVFGSDSGEIPFVVGDGGVILPESDETKWKELIEDFLDQPEKYQSLKTQALARAPLFSAKTIAEQYKEFYRGIINSV